MERFQLPLAGVQLPDLIEGAAHLPLTEGAMDQSEGPRSTCYQLKRGVWPLKYGIPPCSWQDRHKASR